VLRVASLDALAIPPSKDRHLLGEGAVPAEVRTHPAYRRKKQFDRTVSTRSPKEAEAAVDRVLLALRDE
jgi:hypothetical protein